MGVNHSSPNEDVGAWTHSDSSRSPNQSFQNVQSFLSLSFMQSSPLDCLRSEYLFFLLLSLSVLVEPMAVTFNEKYTTGEELEKENIPQGLRRCVHPFHLQVSW